MRRQHATDTIERSENGFGAFMVKVKISELEGMLKGALVRGGLSDSEAGVVALDYLRAEMRGKKTHGITKFIKELDYITGRRGKPEVVIDTGALVLVDANGELGQIAAMLSVDIVTDRAKRYGIAAVGLKNAKRYDTLEPWAAAIAKNDLVGIVANSCEPAGTPYGASSAVLGSNPLAVGIPTSRDPIVLDMATTELAMSTIWNRMLEGKNLPENVFFDNVGNYTVEPSEAVAVDIFGGYKGYGISVAIEVLSGSLICAMMGSGKKSSSDIGYYFQAIDPSAFRNIEEFKAENTRLVGEIKSAARKPGVEEIFVPGEQGNRNYNMALESGVIDLSDQVFNALIEVSR